MPVVPPPPPGPPPPPSFAPPLADIKDAGKGRDLLLQSIRQGKTLRKTTTNDRSSPIVSGKPNGRSENNNMIGSATISRSNNLASLFADGIPKLKPVNPNSSQSTSLTSLPTANSSSLHNSRKPDVAKKLVIDIPKRGPPPQPPSLNQKPTVILSSSTSETTLNSPTVNTHTRSASTVSLVSNGRAGRPMKPQVAPKPPAPAPPIAGVNNKRVHRAHSMRAPSSPPIVPITPQGFPALSKVGGHHASSDSLAARARPGRPPLRPPMSRPPPPPTSAVPPPPPTSAVPPPPPPSVPPPPPPQHPPPPHRPAPPLPSNVPPQPPTRHSSIRNGHGNTSNDFEARFAYYFHSVNEFPPPQRYMGVPKIYNSKNAVGKAHAPPPPPQMQLGNKMWPNNTSSC